MSVIHGPHSPLDALGAVKYSNHSDSAVDAAGNVFSAYTVTRPNDTQDVVVVKRQQGTGVYTAVWTFDQLTYGKQGNAGLAIVFHHVVVFLSARNALDQTLPVEYIIPDVAAVA